MTFIASMMPLACWVFYAVLVQPVEERRPSLTMLMHAQRRRWVANAVRRDTPLDAILSSTIMGPVNFFASTTVLLILTLFAVFGQIGAVSGLLADISPKAHFTPADLRLHLGVMLVMFFLAFLVFTLSLRQFNHYCIILGASDHSREPSEAEIEAITALNALGARYFNNGIRIYYFSVASIAWFVAPWAAILASLLVVGFVIYREFFSAPYRIVSRLPRD